jgi:nucleoside-diphosphate-sugar epimerase
LRSCYPEGKRLAENLCVSYANEYNLSIKIARLAQILGQSKGDNRLIAYLCDSVKNNQTIILNSDGKAEKSFCYIMDCISALIYILVVGENTAYNVANNSMHMSVFELANFVSKKYLSKDVIVNNSNDCKYPKSSYLVLNSDKLMSLGWKPYVDIEEAFDRLLQKQE